KQHFKSEITERQLRSPQDTAHERDVVTGHQQLGAEERAIGGPEKQDIARHAFSSKDDEAGIFASVSTHTLRNRSVRISYERSHGASLILDQSILDQGCSLCGKHAVSNVDKRARQSRTIFTSDV